LAIKIGDALLKLGVDSTELDAGMKKATDNIKAQMKVAGTAMTAFGAATMAALGLATKSAIEQEVGIQRLANTLKNVGVNYADVRAELEANITTMQRKTNYADEEQRDALNQLISITGEYQGSLELLQLATDMATAKQMDLSSAALLVGRAALGDTQLLKRYGIIVAEGATATQILATMQERFGGAAAAAVNPVTQLKNLMSDFMEDIGTLALPILQGLIDSLKSVIEDVRAWIKENPELARQIVILTAVLGGMAAVLGPILLMLPMILTAMAAIGGPIALLIAGISLLTAGLVAMVIESKIADTTITKGAQDTTTALKAENKKRLNDRLESIDKERVALKKAHEEEIARIKEEYGMDDQQRQSKMAFAKQTYDYYKGENDKKIDDAKIAHDKQLDYIYELYGADRDATKSMAQLARDRTSAATDSLNEEMQATRAAYNEKIDLLDKEYRAKVKILDAGTQKVIAKYQAEIDAIDKRTKAEDIALREIEWAKRTTELETAVEEAKGYKAHKEAQEKLTEFLAGIIRQRLLDTRAVEKEGLQAKITTTRESANAEKDSLQEALEATKQAEAAKRKVAEQATKDKKTALDLALTEELTRIKTLQDADIDAANAAWTALETRLTSESTALDTALTDDLARIASDRDAFIEAENAKLAATLRRLAGEQATISETGIVTTPSPYVSRLSPRLEEWQHGGMITEPTLLYGLRSKQPYAIAGEAGPERVGGGGISITITGNDFNVRRDSDINQIAQALVDKIRLKTGVRI